MSSVGDIRIHIYGKGHPKKQIVHACIDCGKERWVAICHGKPENLRCFPCARIASRTIYHNKGTPEHPAIGDIMHKNRSRAYIWETCIDCHKERWTPIYKGGASHLRCRSCGLGHAILPIGASRHNWKGGRTKTNRGYVKIIIRNDDPFYPMANNKRYVLEHRLIMARHLGRCLLNSEYVHHKDGNKENNTIENLELISPQNHQLTTKLCTQCIVHKEVLRLRAEIKLLRVTQQLRLSEIEGGGISDATNAG